MGLTNCNSPPKVYLKNLHPVCCYVGKRSQFGVEKEGREIERTVNDTNFNSNQIEKLLYDTNFNSNRNTPQSSPTTEQTPQTPKRPDYVTTTPSLYFHDDNAYPLSPTAYSLPISTPIVQCNNSEVPYPYSPTPTIPD